MKLFKGLAALTVVFLLCATGVDYYGTSCSPHSQPNPRCFPGVSAASAQLGQLSPERLRAVTGYTKGRLFDTPYAAAAV